MKRFDIIVVGSGPAGSAAAVTARAHGLSVAIVDKATFPRDKLCGGLFTGRSQTALRDTFGMDITPALFRTSHHMRFYANGTELADIPDAPPMHATMRRDLDAVLHAEALKKGATPYLGKPATGIDEAAKTLTIRGGETLGYQVLIGTDGVNSFVARTLFGRAFDPKQISFGLEIETPLTPNRDSAMEIDFRATDWGYGWSFPKHKTMTVGICGINSRNPDMKGHMARYVGQVGGDASLKYKGQYLPFGEYRKTPGRGAILLAGDAAGFVDPITGEGIALAMESGTHAAEAAAQAIADGTPDQALTRYKPRVKPIQTDLGHARICRLVMYPKLTQGYFDRAVASGTRFQLIYLDLLAGKVSYAQLRRMLLRRVPRMMWTLTKQKLGLLRAG